MLYAWKLIHCAIINEHNTKYITSTYKFYLTHKIFNNLITNCKINHKYLIFLY